MVIYWWCQKTVYILFSLFKTTSPVSHKIWSLRTKNVGQYSSQMINKFILIQYETDIYEIIYQDKSKIGSTFSRFLFIPLVHKIMFVCLLVCLGVMANQCK